MSRLIFDRISNQWSGTCPRCGRDGFFITKHSFKAGKIIINLLWCSGQHSILAETFPDTEVLSDAYPVEFHGVVPAWIPTEYQNLYREMLKAFSENMYSSVCALCGILLEVKVNEMIKLFEGDREKKITKPEKIPLFRKLEMLIDKGRINPDQFSSAMVAKLARNETLHPKDLEPIDRESAEQAIEAVTTFLEKEFRFSYSRALPAGDVTEKGETDEAQS